ncbi:MAG: leucine-rich repeat domain-containing protein [Treponema sp.]|nr:leucine-rich repeat domain-containing protein [Treponema sp.]
MKNKRVFVICGIIFFLVSITGSLFAQQSNREEDFDVRIIDGKSIMITNYNGRNSNVIIPARIGNLPVTAIGDNAFKEKQITSVTIPNGVITIGDYAFQNNEIGAIIIPNSVTHIGYEVFGGNFLQSVTIGANVSLGGGRMHGFGISPGFDFRYYRMGRAAGFYWPVGAEEDGTEFWGGPR